MMVISRGWGNTEIFLMGTEFQFEKIKVLRINGGDGCKQCECT